MLQSRGNKITRIIVIANRFHFINYFTDTLSIPVIQDKSRSDKIKILKKDQPIFLSTSEFY